MKRVSVLLLLSVVCFASAMHAQAPAPNPDPELNRLLPLVGHWTFEGEYKPGPVGPRGRFTREYTGQIILAGFFFRERWTENGGLGNTQGFDIVEYNPGSKKLGFGVYTDQGIKFSGVLTVSGNAIRWEG